MNKRDCVALSGFRGELVMFSVFQFIHRNARVAFAVGIVAAAVSTASIIGWITAPV